MKWRVRSPGPDAGNSQRFCGRCQSWLILLAWLSFLAGCRHSTGGPSDLPPPPRGAVALPELARDDHGRVILGDPALTAGIPGAAAELTLPEIEAWLAEERVHEPLSVVLPSHLASAATTASIPAANPLTLAKIELGRQLFFDARLSGSGAMSCGDCHHPKRSYVNFIGRQGKLRDPLPTINRILGTLQFWDGKATSLEDQVRFPIENPLEMRSSQQRTVAFLSNNPGYRMQFDKIFGEVSFAAFAQAVACFERTLVTGPSAWDRRELSAAAQRGEELFFSQRTRCGSCHRGPNLTDEAFHNVGTATRGTDEDWGRFQVTNQPADRGVFKTPSLRNVALTGPYFHDARFESLAEVVAWFDSGGNGNEREGVELQPLGLSENEQRDLVAFLESLTSDLPPVATGGLPPNSSPSRP